MTEEGKQVENIGAGKETAPAAQQPLTAASTNTPAGSTPSSKPQGQPLVCHPNAHLLLATLYFKIVKTNTCV